MSEDRDYTVKFEVDRTAEEVFDAVVTPRRWWTGEFDGEMDHVGAEFTYRFADMHYSKQRVSELVPGKRVVWLVTEAYLSFLDDRREWEGTRIEFTLRSTPAGTEVVFTHVGLREPMECYDACSSAWSTLVLGSLRQLILTGEDQPPAF